MYNLTYEKMISESDADIPQLTEMYQMPEVSQYISIGENYFHYVTSASNVYFYKVHANDKLVGAIHIEKLETVLYMAILVFPQFQKRGIGTRIIEDIKNDICGLGYEKIEISVDEKNAASLKLFKNAGFVCVSKEDGLMSLVYGK